MKRRLDGFRRSTTRAGAPADDFLDPRQGSDQQHTLIWITQPLSEVGIFRRHQSKRRELSRLFEHDGLCLR